MNIIIVIIIYSCKDKNIHMEQRLMVTGCCDNCGICAEAAAIRTSSPHAQSKTASMSVDGRRFVSETEWQLLQKEVCTFYHFFAYCFA